jgi:hypothetical protein
MKIIAGRASALVQASLRDCFELLADIEAYPRWAGDLVTGVELVQRDAGGMASQALLRLYVRQSPVGRNFELRASLMTHPPDAVRLSRLPRDAGDHDRLELMWSLSRPRETRIELSFHAETSLLPSVVPLFGVGDAIAEHLVDRARSAMSS